MVESNKAESNKATKTIEPGQFGSGFVAQLTGQLIRDNSKSFNVENSVATLSYVAGGWCIGKLLRKKTKLGERKLLINLKK